jgi:hypothetical protein
VKCTRSGLVCSGIIREEKENIGAEIDERIVERRKC